MDNPACYVIDTITEEDLAECASLEDAKKFCEDTWLNVEYREVVPDYIIDVYSNDETVAEIEMVKRTS